MTKPTKGTCERHRDVMTQAAEKATESHAEPCRVCLRPTTHRDAYGPLCPEYCSADDEERQDHDMLRPDDGILDEGRGWGR